MEPEKSGFMSSLARNYRVWVAMPMVGLIGYLGIAGKDPDISKPANEYHAIAPIAEKPIKHKSALKYATRKLAPHAVEPAKQDAHARAEQDISSKLFSGQQWLENAVMRKIDDIVHAEDLRKQGKKQVSIDDLGVIFSRGTAYRDYIEPMSKETGMPISVLYALTARESSCSHLTFGPTKDAGLWQISPDTGRRLGLLTKEADYRFDPERSTKAIGRMFGELKNRYGNRWHLIANAYNHGGSNLDRDLKTRTPMKTHVRDHTISVMAYAYLYEMRGKYGIQITDQPLYSEKARNTRMVKVGKAGLSGVAKAYKTTANEISYLNPAVLNPVRGYETKGYVRLPF